GLALAMTALPIAANAQTPPRAVNFGPNQSWTTQPYFGSMGTFFADVDGDGKADAIVVNSNTITVRSSSGSSFGSNQDWTHGPYFGTHGTFFADVNGDGKADAIVVNDNTVIVRRSTADCFIVCVNYRFGSNEDWTHGPYFGSTMTTFADVDGDGKADAIVVNGSQVVVRRSDGSKFKPNEIWTSSFTPGTWGTYFFDVDGDGKADLIAVNQSSILVNLSTGNGFAPATNWTGTAWVPGNVTGLRSVAFARFNWFGLSSAMIYVTDNNVLVFPAQTALGQTRYKTQITSPIFVSFSGPVNFTTNPYFGNLGTFFADVTGDINPDAIVVNTSNIVVRPATP
ncbi:MAG TPA: VCBS repeat-containing protein, partial [Steroidobacteraceae bacterium]|nr:VCBS repeat-containing protein [Steroidobacteraceae bacterium]